MKDKEKNEFIQVAWDLDDEKTRQREIASLLEAMEEQKLKKGLILTFNTRENLSLNNKSIAVQPTHQWLIE